MKTRSPHSSHFIPKNLHPSSRGWLFLLPLLLISLSGCGKKPPQKLEMPPRPVTTARVIKQDIPLYIDSIGQCTALAVVSIQAQVSGQLVNVHFTQGQEVKKGDLLFTIDPRYYQAAVNKAMGDLSNSVATVKLNEDQVRRSRELVSGEYISPQDFESQETSVATAKAQVMSNKGALDQAKVNLDYCFIRAPVSGRTGLLLVDAGNIVAPSNASSSNNSLVSLQTLDPIYVDFTIVEKDLFSVKKYAAKKNLKVDVSLVDNPQFKRSGELFVIDNAVIKGAGTVKLRAIIPNQDRALWPQQFVNTRLVLDTKKDALLVPSEAVKAGQLGAFVFIVKADNTVDLRQVKVGQAHDNMVEIKEGVNMNETVVTTGQLTLSPGAAILDTTKQQAAPPAPGQAPAPKK
ncbi:MAG: efflux RND transporter periplasmic adaptor subunit [Verrucomicrobiae bacterium]|nr:efflux RND transporter periplasmic adaptor subunit [Verrucomicrobiae bacterium]